MYVINHVRKGILLDKIWTCRDSHKAGLCCCCWIWIVSTGMAKLDLFFFKAAKCSVPSNILKQSWIRCYINSNLWNSTFDQFFWLWKKNQWLVFSKHCKVWVFVCKIVKMKSVIFVFHVIYTCKYLCLVYVIVGHTKYICVIYAQYYYKGDTRFLLTKTVYCFCPPENLFTACLSNKSVF